ncbi:MAG: tetratricopeptide repeat protein [Muribaculum sp.]|nr:tetratricopeptide repeat protein [Muribaculum sp.]
MNLLHKIVIATATTLISIMTLHAETAETLTQQADSAYMRDDFSSALSLYLDIADNHGTSAPLYYNIANCYYRLGQPGKAIVYYERALRLDPSDRDTRDNLDFVNSRITDEPGDRGMFITKTVNAIATRVGANTWATLAIISFIMLLVCVALYVLPSAVTVRKIGFFGAFAMVAICIVANILASIATEYSTAHDEAIVTVPATMLSTSPRAPKDRSEEALLLHEGTKVQILDSVTSRIDSVAVKWFDVRVDNEHRAWIKGSDIERI